jgi:Brp/Blh family beta-carotene 15,15'-monooxygenase
MAALLVGVQWILPQDALWFDLVCIIVFGLPHGALDVEIAREHLVGRMPRLWFPVFAIPYLTMACAVLGLWHAYPVAALCLFLSMSVWHFGETPGFPWWLRLLRGGAVIALPVLLHPAMTAGLLDGIAQIAMPECPAWIKIGSLAWLGLCLAAVAARTVPVPLLRELALLAALYAALPPLTALAIYFVCLHAPAHMHEMIDHRLSARVTSMAAAWCYALPPTLLTLAIGAMLWPLYTGAPVERLLALTLQGLAALTVPHMLMDCVMKRV